MASSIHEQPLNLAKWIQDNAHLLQPPVGDYRLSTKPLLIQLVGGPNARLDFHINSTPEIFYQIKGCMLLRTIQEERDPASNQTTDDKTAANTVRDIVIREGDLYLLPADTPHSPIRFKDSVGLVIEQPRPEGVNDLLQWYCQNCGELIHQAGFICVKLGEQIKEAVKDFDRMSKEYRTCAKCGEVCQSKPTPNQLRRFESYVYPE